MRVGAAKAGGQPQEQRDHPRRDPSHDRARVVGPLHRLRPDHQVHALAQHRQRALVEADVAEIDLVADDELAARFEDPALQGASVVGLVALERADARNSGCQVGDDGAGSVGRAVLGEDQLELPAEIIELAAQLQRRLADDRRLVVDGNDDRDHVGGGHVMTPPVAGSADPRRRAACGSTARLGPES